MRGVCSAVCALASAPALAVGPWAFTDAIDVDGAAREGVFHHLDSSGRRSIAVSGEVVAVVWEDNRDGSPQAYVAFKKKTASGFSPAQQVSAGRVAYEPAVTAVGEGQFAVAWEQDGAVWTRIADITTLGKPQQLSRHPAGQAHLDGTADGTIHMVWAEQVGSYNAIHYQVLHTERAAFTLKRDAAAMRVDASAETGAQLYPVVTQNGDGVVVAWEDRRAGHTQIYTAHRGGEGQFGAPQRLNPLPPSRVPFGKGTGAMRAALANGAGKQVVAVWLDKRDFTGGYDVYAALSSDGGRRFGKAHVVQDEFGNNIAQWHAAVAADGRGGIVAAWDDRRDETGDIWLSWRTGDGWSEDQGATVAAGPGEQTHPAIAFDAAGMLHLAWIDRRAADGPTRLRYAAGRGATGP